MSESGRASYTHARARTPAQDFRPVCLSHYLIASLAAYLCDTCLSGGSFEVVVFKDGSEKFEVIFSKLDKGAFPVSRDKLLLPILAQHLWVHTGQKSCCVLGA